MCVCVCACVRACVCVYRVVSVACILEQTFLGSQHFQLLKIETDRLSVGLYIIAVAGVLRLRDQNKNKCQEGAEITELFDP